MGLGSVMATARETDLVKAKGTAMGWDWVTGWG